jgi:hypothetical protein
MATAKLKKAAKQEQKELDKGYDDAVSEKKGSNIMVEIEGKEFPVPAKKPAWIDLFIARYGRGKGKEVPADKYLDFILNLMGDDIVDHLIDKADNDFDTEDLMEKVIWRIQDVWAVKGKKK